MKSSLRVIAFALLALVSAHAQFSKVNSVEFQQAGVSISGAYFTYGFRINCSTNMTCTVSGNTLTMVAASTGSVAWSALTAGTNSNAGTFAMSGNTLDLTAATLVKLRVAGGLTTSANGDLGYDTTNKNWHIWANAVDNFVAVVPVSVSITSGHLATWSLVSGVLTLNDGGAVPAAGVSSVSGDSALITNSGSTGAVTLTVGNALAHKFWGNNTGSTQAASFMQLACADLSNAGAFCNGTAYGSLTGVPSTFAPSAHNLLSSAHGDTTAASVAVGDIITGQTGPIWARLAANSTATKKYLQSVSTGAPSWQQIAYADVSGTPQLAQTITNVAHKWLNSYDAATGLFTQTQPDYSDLTGVPSTFAPSAHNLLSSAHGDTTAASAVRGDGIFAIGASPTWQRLAHSSATGGYFKWNGTDQVASTGAAGGTGACTSGQYETTDNADAAPTCAQVAYSQLSGTPTLRYQTVQDEGSDLAQEPKVNFVGAGVTCVDNAGLSTDCTVTSGGGSGASTADSFITVNHDADLTGERTLAGTANHITVTDGGANNSVTLDTGANVTLSGALSNNTIPKANAAAGLVNSSITDDATTITLPELAVISPTWNNIATLFTGLKENVTDTASQRNSLLADLQVGGSSKFAVEKSGTTTIGQNPQPTQPSFIDQYGTPVFIGAPKSGYCRHWYDTTYAVVRFTDVNGTNCGSVNFSTANVMPKYVSAGIVGASLVTEDGTSLTYNASGGGKWCPSGATSGTWCLQVPASITSYNWTIPSADGAGRIKSDGAGVLSIDDGNDATEVWMQDEFVGGLLTTGQIGDLNWAMAGSAACGAATQPASVWPNLGQFQTTTGAASGNTCGITFAAASALGALGSNAGWTMTWVFKIPTTTTMGAYLGASDSLTAVPSNWFGVRYDTSIPDSVFKLCVSATCDATTYTLDSNFHKLRIRSTTATTILMKFDNNTERSFCASGCNTTVTPSTNVMTAIAQAVTRTTAARNVDVDYFAFRATGLSR